MANAIAQYRKVVKAKLRCDNTEKERILKRFDHILSAYAEEHDTPAMDDLTAAFGPPEEMADMLMSEVPSQEQKRYRKRTLLMQLLIGVLALVLALSTIYIWFYKDTGLSSSDELNIIDHNVHSTIDTEQGDREP